MSLEKFYNKKFCDKNQAYVDKYPNGKPKGHTYLPLYEELFHKKKSTAEKILEIGVQRGGSIYMWEKYFSKAEIFGIDIVIDPKK